LSVQWKLRQLDEFVRFRNGKSIKAGTAGMYPVFGSNGIIGSANDFMYEDAIILGRVGAYCGSVERSRGRFWASDNTIVVEPLDEVSDTQFVYYLLVDAALNRYAGGAAQPLLTQSRLKPLEFRLPRLPIQRRIASILSAYDDLIENNTRRIAILEEMARRLYEEWFVRFRFPGHEEVGFEGELPKGWQEVKLQDVASVNSDTIKPKSAPDYIRYIDIASVSPGRIEKTREMAFEDAPSRARRRVRDGDIIWSCVRPNRRSHALVLKPEDDTVASTGFAVLRAERVPFSFLLAATTTDAFADYLTNHATGAAYPAVKQSDFEAADLCLPPRELLDTYGHLAEPMCRLAHALDRKNTNLRNQRDLLLPKLVSGEIDVSEAEEGLAGVAA
jgi:type I restriction enzyme S subunit